MMFQFPKTEFKWGDRVYHIDHMQYGKLVAVGLREGIWYYDIDYDDGSRGLDQPENLLRKV